MIFKTNHMDLKTLNRIDKLRRLKSRGPRTPKWLKPYHLLFMAFLTVFIFGAIIKLLEQKP
ncbi:hypothetical protein ACM46_06250 [Chryseobacterium angstadtii]|uniref:Uncharacterized protein n=2 Tax=Chryseobacterium angstadtii TaxID=558151 RepID=A0A0J7IHB8_9FLAO|nr:hypothetical protein ACM46_06250 [Chryseobacterium angstadtii]